MNWAQKRQASIAGILVLVFVALSALLWWKFLYVPPSCVDHKQNGNERGVDCGGSCTYICAADVANPEPTIKFVRTLSPLPGRTDVVAYVDNANGTVAASQASYTLEVFNDQNALVGKRTGTIDLLPGVTTPLFFSNVVSGDASTMHAFLTIDPASVHWVASSIPEKKFAPENVQFAPGDSPRLTATIRNLTVASIGQTAFVATLFDAQGNAVGASATVIVSLAPKDSAPVVFTWPTAIGGDVSRIEILPVLSL